MSGATLDGRRVLITGAARGLGALTARRLHARGARVALLGLEPESLTEVARECGDAPWFECDVADRTAVDEAVERAVAALGGLDVAFANAGIAGQLALVGGDPSVFDQTIAVNLMGTYNLIRAAGGHVSHRGGYFLLTSSLAAVVHGPLISAYSASKAAVEALGNSLRIELRPSGARVGIAYYAELETEMTSRGFATKAAALMPLGGHGRIKPSPVEPVIDMLEHAIRVRARRVVYPRWGLGLLASRAVIPYFVERGVRRNVARALELARAEQAPLTTPQPDPRSAKDER